MAKVAEACVHSVLEEGTCELVLENPGRKNALSLSLLRDLTSKLREARGNGTRAVILAGAGDAFSAGADLTELTGTLDDLAIDDAIEQAVQEMRSLPVPVIGAIEGPCMGGAVDVALACDVLVASQTAYFEVPATRMGLLYNPAAVARWRERVSSGALRTILLLGERVTADRAVAMGLVSFLSRTGGARDRAWELARRASSGDAEAIAATKGLLAALDDGETDLQSWDRIRTDILASPERLEAIARAKKLAPTGRRRTTRAE